MRLTIFAISVFVLFHTDPSIADELEKTELETATCGVLGIKGSEVAYLKTTRKFAESWKDDKNPDFVYAEVQLRTLDGRSLSGYRVHKASYEKLRGAIVVLHGDAMSIDQLVEDVYPVLAENKFAVYGFDYRGYRKSTGHPRFRAFFSDAKEIVNYVGQREEGDLHLYGLSLGGIIGANLLHATDQITKAVLDSVPSELGFKYGCPKNYNPIESIPDETDSVVAIVNLQDQVFSQKKLKEFADAIDARNGRRIDFDSGHPLNEPMSKLSERMILVSDIFSEGQTE